MEDKFLHEPLNKKQTIKNIDGYIDYYLDFLAWNEGIYDTGENFWWVNPIYFTEFEDKGYAFEGAQHI